MGELDKSKSDESKRRTEQIIVLHGEIHELLKIGLEKAQQIGEQLILQKKFLGHGKFDSWIKKELPFTKQTAYKYRRLYRYRKLLKRKKVNLLNEAYQVIDEDKRRRAGMAQTREGLRGEPKTDEDKFFLEFAESLIKKIGKHARQLKDELYLLKDEFRGWSVEQVKSFEFSLTSKQLKELMGLLTKLTVKGKGIAHTKRVKSKVL